MYCTKWHNGLLKFSDLDLARLIRPTEDCFRSARLLRGQTEGDRRKKIAERGFCVSDLFLFFNTVFFLYLFLFFLCLSVNPCPQARLTSWVKENPGSWFSEFKRGKLVSQTSDFPKSFPECLLYFTEQNGKMAQRLTRHMV